MPLLLYLQFPEIILGSYYKIEIAWPSVRRSVIVNMPLVRVPRHWLLNQNILHHVFAVFGAFIVILHFDVHLHITLLAWRLIIIIANFPMLASKMKVKIVVVGPEECEGQGAGFAASCADNLIDLRNIPIMTILAGWREVGATHTIFFEAVFIQFRSHLLQK